MTGIMAAYFRNDGWKEDVVLKEEMVKYVNQGFQRREMLDFWRRDFAKFAWSLRYSTMTKMCRWKKLKML